VPASQQSTPVRNHPKNSGCHRVQRAKFGLEFAPDSKAIVYGVLIDGVENLYEQSIEGGPARPITHFQNDTLVHFEFSPDGKILVTQVVDR